MTAAYPDPNILRLLVIRAARGDLRLAYLAMMERSGAGNSVQATICAMRDAKIWRPGEDQARRHWARRGVVWLAAGEERP